MLRWTMMLRLGFVCFIGACSRDADEATSVADEVATHTARIASEADAGPSSATNAPLGLQAAFVRAVQVEGASDARFRFTRERGALIARNPARRVTGRFASAGMEVVTHAGSRGALRTAALRCDRTRVSAGAATFGVGESENRVEREVGSDALTATEWIENGPMGLEQGFDVRARRCDELAIELEVDGFRAELAGDSVRLVGHEDVLRYAQLFAIDAEGQTLPSRFDVADTRVTLLVDTHTATWPVVVDPLVYSEEQVVAPSEALGSDGAPGDLLGWAVALDGDRAVVGAPFDSVVGGSAYVFVRDTAGWSLEAKLIGSVPTSQFGWSVDIEGDTILVGASGDAALGPRTGAVYVFVRTGAVWHRQARLTAVDGASGDLFGTSVALSADTAVVGAPNGLGSTEQGAAYVFVRVGGVWRQQATLTPAAASGGDALGRAVAIFGDMVLVGAPGAEGGGVAYVFVRSGEIWAEQTTLRGSMGTVGFAADVALFEETALVGAAGEDAARGAAYMFVRTGTTWSEEARLVAPIRVRNDAFGRGVALYGETALVGASQRGFEGTRRAAHVFARTGTTWTLERTLQVADAPDAFGSDVALSEDTALVGAHLHDHEGMVDSGAVYVFARTDTSWSPPTMLTPGAGAHGDFFGGSVAISGDTALVAAWRDDTYRGSVYVFVKEGALWTLQTRLMGEAPYDYFGFSVALSEDTAIVGAYGVDGDASGGRARGAAYVFHRTGTTWALQAKLSVGDGANGDYFGYAVALEGDTAVVGASGKGAAYVFSRSGTTWVEVASLRARDASEGDEFGASVALFGDSVVIGEPSDDHAGSSSGSAYVYVRLGARWVEQAKLVAPDAEAADRFGGVVALFGDLALVGAIHDDDDGPSSGAVHVFSRRGTTWYPEAKLTASDGSVGAYFGNALALEGEAALVGAPGERSPGAAYVFVRNGTTWSEVARWTAADATPEDNFGFGVALSRTQTLIGAPRRRSPPPFGHRAGAAYFGTLTRLTNGEPCGGAAVCASGFCVDGVCCDDACGGDGGDDCRACAVAAGATADGVCTGTTGNACDDGLTCSTIDVCEAGTCVGRESPCDVSTGCSEGETFVCGPCPEGTYSADGSGASACVPWTVCEPGHFESRPGSATRDRTCTRCTRCGDQEREGSACTLTTDTVCVASVDGGGVRDGGARSDAGLAGGLAGGGCDCRADGSGAGSVVAFLLMLVPLRRRCRRSS